MLHVHLLTGVHYWNHPKHHWTKVNWRTLLTMAPRYDSLSPVHVYNTRVSQWVCVCVCCIWYAVQINNVLT